MDIVIPHTKHQQSLKKIRKVALTKYKHIVYKMRSQSPPLITPRDRHGPILIVSFNIMSEVKKRAKWP